jgi:hypothetical protein
VSQTLDSKLAVSLTMRQPSGLSEDSVGVTNREELLRAQKLTRIIGSMVRPYQVQCHLMDFYGRDAG